MESLPLRAGRVECIPDIEHDMLEQGDQPVNSADAACKQHDLDYARIVEEQRAGKLTSEQVDQQVREADDRMLRAVERTKGEGGLVSRFHHAVGKQANDSLFDAGKIADALSGSDSDDDVRQLKAAKDCERKLKGYYIQRKFLPDSHIESLLEEAKARDANDWDPVFQGYGSKYVEEWDFGDEKRRKTPASCGTSL
eukprot:COSAG01_NODE_530_length_15875_cov_27.779982_13_plen_196_part_00